MTTESTESTVDPLEERVLATLRRVPDRIILAVMGRDIDLLDDSSCLCGWIIREKLAEIQNVGASTLGRQVSGSGLMCQEAFGGEEMDWVHIHGGVCIPSHLPTIERAFVRRVDEAVFGREVTS